MRCVCFVLVVSVASSVIGAIISVAEQDKDDIAAYDRELDRLFEQILEEQRTNGKLRYYDSTLDISIPIDSDEDYLHPVSTPPPVGLKWTPNTRRGSVLDMDTVPRFKGVIDGGVPSVDESRKFGPDPVQTDRSLLVDGLLEPEGSAAPDVLRTTGHLRPPSHLTEDNDDDDDYYESGSTTGDSDYGELGSGNVRVAPLDSMHYSSEGDDLVFSRSEELSKGLEATTDSAYEYSSEALQVTYADRDRWLTMELNKHSEEEEEEEEELSICLQDIGPIKETFRKCIHAQLEPPNLHQTAKNVSSSPNHRDYTHFLRSCRKTNPLRKCFKDFYDSKLELCPNDDAGDLLDRLRELGVAITEFICKTEADRIMLLIADGVLVCLRDNAFKMLRCLDAHFSFMQEAVFESTSPRTPGEKCNDLREAERCFNRQLESCEDTTLPDIGLVGLVFDLARELASCGATEPALKSTMSYSQGEEGATKHGQLESSSQGEEGATKHGPLESSSQGEEGATKHDPLESSSQDKEGATGHGSLESSSQDKEIATGHGPLESSSQDEEVVEGHNAENIIDNSSKDHQEDRHNTEVQENPQDNTNQSSYVEANKTNEGGHLFSQYKDIKAEDDELTKNTFETKQNHLSVEDQLISTNQTLTASRNVSVNADNVHNATPNSYAAVGIILGIICAILVCVLLSTVTFRRKKRQPY